MLAHYTNRIEAVANILTHGFAWIPNRRKLANLLIPQHDFSAREPQQFGMISFTDIPPASAGEHTARFGRYGIVVSEEWARQRGAQPVIYVDERGGPATEALRSLFEIGYAEVRERIKYPADAAWSMAYENRQMAAWIGATLWARLLRLWEFLEPATSSQQREWRIVNERPVYGLSENVSEAIARVTPPGPAGKHVLVVPVAPCDIEGIVCPEGDIEAMRAALPSEFREIPIIDTRSRFREWLRQLRAKIGS